LIAVKYAIVNRQLVDIEHGFQVLVLKNQLSPGRLKTAFRQLGLNEQMTQVHINLCAISSTADEWNSRLHSEPWPQSGLDPEKRTHRFPAGHSRIAEDIHEQGVGAVGAIQFPPSSVGRARKPLAAV